MVKMASRIGKHHSLGHQVIRLPLDTVTNMPFAGILSLPPELLEEIIDYLAMSPQEILTLRCVNKTLCSLVTPAAFREIVAHTTDESTQGFLELLVSTDIAKHVRVVKIIEDPGTCGLGYAGGQC